MSKAPDLTVLRAVLDAHGLLPAPVEAHDRANGVLLVVNTPLGVIVTWGESDQDAIDRCARNLIEAAA